MRKYLLSLLLLWIIKQLSAQTSISLPAPHATKSHTNYSHVKGWKPGETPQAPAGFEVLLYADGFENPRWLYELPNGDILVAESNSNHSTLTKIGAAIIGANKSNSMKHSVDRITLLRDTNHDGIPDVRTVFLQQLEQPFGMLLIGNYFYVANTNALLRYPYRKGDTLISATPTKIAELPAGSANRHWTRNIITNKEQSKIYIAVGSGTDHAEKGLANEQSRAAILEVNPDGTGLHIYASGLRNPVGMGWAPGTQTLWVAVNERDKLGDDLVPDYLTSVKEGGFYGWPWTYYGQHRDPRVKEPAPPEVKNTIIPDVPLGAHTASLGLVFYSGDDFPEKYHNGAFIAQHGSWNRKPVSGYKVLFVPFEKGKPSGKPEDFLTGFVTDSVAGTVKGRPVGLLLTHDGSLLVTDDKTNRIWKVRYGKKGKM
ncbi:PQQ-dependent sugar dehydrogenase [Chitinophaga arvensicola]|uniref:Glucose/arabinose dehydrogenase, beta-propeller fold n=1 Tax=Chitinophaga arvensicola TaxID=29529 RepID=A0A1I0RED0_9BACT|nr:sorbosone dehydrogenase family protein [Chitinophaga arvensicola]SEW39115.1 Glucose/arabinose dehydrogenase, beta-propeller fold [Chitinophaga arvensicola]